MCVCDVCVCVMCVCDVCNVCDVCVCDTGSPLFFPRNVAETILRAYVLVNPYRGCDYSCIIRPKLGPGWCFGFGLEPLALVEGWETTPEPPNHQLGAR